MFIDELIFQGRLLMIDECGLVLLLLKLILLLFYVVLIMHARITHILKIKSNNGSSQSVITSIAAIAYGGAIRRHGGRLSCLSIVLVPKHFYNS